MYAASYLPLLLALCASGLFAGLVAGLFGIGGGVVIVPVLFFLFSSLGFELWAQHLAVATSLATIIITSARSVAAHHALGNVDWPALIAWAPWIMAGAVLGGWGARYLPGGTLTLIFGVTALLLSLQFWFGRADWRLSEDLPRGPARAALGGSIGGASALLGIGGGTFGVTLLAMCGRRMQTAVGTGAGFGVAIGLPGALGAVLGGQGAEGLPPFSLGFVNLPAFAVIAALTVLVAPIGARLADRLDAGLLRRLFAVLLAVAAARMIWSALGA